MLQEEDDGIGDRFDAIEDSLDLIIYRVSELEKTVEIVNQVLDIQTQMQTKLQNQIDSLARITNLLVKSQKELISIHK